MNITDEQRRLCAKFEAHLRGGNWMACESASDCLRSGLAHQPATPPDTADGREWWAEALRLHVGTLPPSTIWRATTWAINPKESVSCARESRSEAITATIVAAAEAWEASK